MTNVRNMDSEGQFLAIDKHVGDKIKKRRIILGFSQKQLGVSVGVTPQQIQKYESAVNRVSSSMLYNISSLLKVPIEYFFSGMLLEGGSNLAEEQTPFEHEEEVPEKELVKLMHLYRSLGNSDVRRKLLQFLEALVTNA